MTQRIYLVHSADGKIGPEEFRNQPSSIGKVFKVQSNGTVGLVNNTFADIEGNPTDNTNLATALGEKIPWTAILDSESVSNANLWSSEYSKSKIDALTAVASIKVVDAYPDTPVEGTMYYCGTSAPFQIYFYVNGTKYDFGQTPVDMSSYLKTSGGTMNGSIIINPAISAGQYSLRCGNNSSWISLCGGSDPNSASMELRGRNCSINAGGFEITAHTDSQYAQLKGTPAGALTWCGNKIGYGDNDNDWKMLNSTAILYRKVNGTVYYMACDAPATQYEMQGVLEPKYRPHRDIRIPAIGGSDTSPWFGYVDIFSDGEVYTGNVGGNIEAVGSWYVG